MLILLLPATFISLFLTINGYHTRQQTPLADWSTAFLQSATLLGGYMVLFSELISLFHALTTIWVAIFWLLGLAITLFIGLKKGWLPEGFLALKNSWKKPDWFDILAGTILTIILVIIFFIAIKSPVNNNDALLYHMSRVVHWIQNESFRHYATNYEHQLINPIFAELTIANISLLWRSDQLSNLVQWYALVGCIIGISGLSRLLKTSKNAIWIAVAYAISLPLAILQATNPQNDLVVAFWLISLLYFLFLGSNREITILEVIFFALALGLGLLTKGTFYAYAIVPFFYFIYSQINASGYKRAVINTLLTGVIVLVINFGFWSRNTITFGTPLGPQIFISNHTANGFSPIKILGKISLGFMQNFASPSENFNNEISKWVQTTLGGYDSSAKSFSLVWAWNHEDLAGNPIQISLAVLTTLILLVFLKKCLQISKHYLFLVLGIYISLETIVFYGIYGIRFQLPVLLAFSPLAGVVGDIFKRKWFYYLVTLLLLLSAFPWVIFNRTRPLIAMRDSSDPYTIPCLAGCTAGSILNEPPEKTMFAVWGNLGSAYVEAMNQVKQMDCKEIGLKLDSNDLEYAYWNLLGAPQNGMRLESIVTYPELERYLDPTFKPCVIICTTCGEQGSLFGLNRIGSFGDGRIKIFSGGDYIHPQP